MKNTRFSFALKAIFLSVLLCFGLATSSALAQDFDAMAEHAIAVEASTGKILYEKDADTPDGIASITKLLTIYLVYKDIKEGKLSWNTKVDISDYAYDLTTDSLASNVPMEKRQYTVKELVNASLVASANSAAIALAEKVGGSESKFVDMMSAQLKEWGITDASLVNSSGLNNSMLGDNIYPGSSSDAENMMSAKDVAIVARHLILDFPEVLDITSQSTSDFDGVTMTSSNLMLKYMTSYRDGVDGLKTGTTDLAGACFVGTTEENGMRIITVILNADNGDTDSTARFTATNNLMNYIYTTYTVQTVLEKGQSYKNSTVEVLDGKKTDVSAVAKDTFKVITPRTTASTALTFDLKKETPTAPVIKGQTVATLTYKDKSLVGSGYLDGEPSVQMVAKNDVKRSFFLKVWWNHFVRYVNEKL